ncbi:MFS transporter [Micromonospora sp. NPDC126480]|uniref:MFS transporter n=1 Tax=Micromonospora sp. NPDC126480 TaxID=3155312 RepID=UPI003332A36E
MDRQLTRDVAAPVERGWSPRALTAILVAQFIAFGIVLGVQGVIWIEVMTNLALSEGIFGTLQLALPLVGLLVLMFNGQLYTGLGTKLQSIVALALLGAGMLVLAVTDNLWTFTLALALSGLGFAMLDAATNSAGMDLEQATGRHVMNIMHGLQSAGVMAGAVVTGLVLAAGLSFQAVSALSVLVFCVPVVLATLPVRFAPALQEDDSSAGDGSLLRSPAFLKLAGITFLGSAAEAVAVVWTVIYVVNLDAPIALSGVTYAIFNGAMLVGRFLNAPVVARFGPRVSLLISSLGILVAVVPLLVFDNVGTAVVAFTVLGLAVAGVQPTALSAAAPLAANTGSVAAGIMMSAYAALLVAPLAYGWVADFTSLRAAMLVLGLCGFFAVWLSLRLPRAKATAPTP